MATIYDVDRKSKKGIEELTELKEIGVLSGVSDCMVTPLGDGSVSTALSLKGLGPLVDGLYVYDLTVNPLKSLARPSETIEDSFRDATDKIKYLYTTALMETPHMMYGDAIKIKMEALARMCFLPHSTVGIKLCLEGREPVLVHNPLGVAVFNTFNSSPVYFEAHCDADVLLLAVAFLKYNSLWGEISANMDLYKFDYAGALFDDRWCRHERSFSVFRAQLINSYFKCKRAVRVVADREANPEQHRRDGETPYKRKRGCDGDCAGQKASDSARVLCTADTLESSSNSFGKEALAASFACVGHASKCPHPELLSVRLDEQGTPGCVACFCTIFFIPEDAASAVGFVVPKDIQGGAQRWIDERLKEDRMAVDLDDEQENSNRGRESEIGEALRRLADITQSAHGQTVKLGEGGRRWNWPSSTAAASLHEFVIGSTLRLLKGARRRLLPSLRIGMLYRLLNPFGKMLLLFIHNQTAIAAPQDSAGMGGCRGVPRGKATGRWWDVNFVGPNIWKFQITKCGAERGVSVDKLACLETLHRLPNLGEKVADDRLVFKGFCRGENLGVAGQVVSDITQSVKNMVLFLENRSFIVDADATRIRTVPAVTEPYVSLEVTGYRNNRALNTFNGGRVSARIMRMLGSREGARVWYSPPERAVLVEGVNHDERVSTEAMERAISQHRILYYDIETNTKDFTEEGAVITSIGFCLCTGGDISKGGERGVFGLAAPGTEPEAVRAEMAKLYPSCGSGENQDGEYVVTDHPPDIVRIFSCEFEMLLAFAKYVDHRKPHVVCGFNSESFDDPFVFTRTVKHLSDHNNAELRMASFETAVAVLPARLDGYGERNSWRMTEPAEKGALAGAGMFKYLGRLINPNTGLLARNVSRDLLTGAKNLAGAKYNERNKLASSTFGSAGWYQKIMGSCCPMVRLDLMRACEKAYKESLPEFTLNAVLERVSSVGDRLKNVKDVVDLNYHLLGFLKLRSAKDQATVHVYCCKDAYLTGVVSTSINKEGEVFRLSLDSGLTEAVVTSNLVTPLCIGEGAMCRNMGAERSDRRGVGVRRHSIATETKGGLVSQAIVNHVPYQTLDMASLYPMTMIQFNLCTSTFVTQRQVVELRDRMVSEGLEVDPSRDLLALLDECNQRVLEYYRPIDLAISSWKNSNTDGFNFDATRLERQLGVRFVIGAGKDEAPEGLASGSTGSRRRGNASPQGDRWCRDAPPNLNLTAAGADYFPEILCDFDLQYAAKVNDDTHISPASLEYLVQVLPLIALRHPDIAAHITAGRHQTFRDILSALEADFTEEEDRKIIASHWTFSGVRHDDFSAGPTERTYGDVLEITGREASEAEIGSGIVKRVVVLCDRIFRRVNAFDSADDPAVRKWSSRLLNVGALVRTWNAKSSLLQGVVPSMQKKYRADRVVMQKAAKDFAAAGDATRAGLNKVGQLTTKLSMNSIYGCFALRSRSGRKEFVAGKRGNAADISNLEEMGGLGGGTRHSVTANQITENGRCVIRNAGNGLQHAIPCIKQAYGDTDSVFCVHNIMGDGGLEPVLNAEGRMVYLMDLLLKIKIARLAPILINTTVKGIRFSPRRDAGNGMMKIAHERLTFASLLFAKKTYHMLQFNEDSEVFRAMIEGCRGKGHVGVGLDEFASFPPRPEKARGYVAPHNPGLLFRAASKPGGEQLKKFLHAEGIEDERSMAAWFSSSETWLALDAETVNNLYASKMVDSEKGCWIDATTSRTLRDPAKVAAVSRANLAFKIYRKGAFVKKAITSTAKLKGLQSLFARCGDGDGRSGDYEAAVRHHVNNFASHTTNPAMVITSARVNKFEKDKEQNRPNPLAVAINNHLNPSTEIQLREKFKAVPSVSAWTLVADRGEVPAGYYNSGGVRWNPNTMKGSVPALSIKNLSAAPNMISAVYGMMLADKTAVSAMIRKNLEVLCTAAANSGFSLRRGAISFSTGIVLSRDIALACLDLGEDEGDPASAAGGKRRWERDGDEGGEDNDIDGAVLSGPSSCGNEERGGETRSFVDADGGVRSDILKRLKAVALSPCRTRQQRERVAQLTKDMSLRNFIVEFMKLDTRVADQMDALISQMEIIKSMSHRRRHAGGTYKSLLDDMVSKTEVHYSEVLAVAGDLIRLHWKKCPVCIPPRGSAREEEEVGVPFVMALEAMAGKYKCTNTCELACCQSLYFVVLTSLSLKLENERREKNMSPDEYVHLLTERVFDGRADAAREVVRRMKDARARETVKAALPDRYNEDTQALVYLFEPSKMLKSDMSSGMTAGDLTRAIKDLAWSKTTGRIWDFNDKRFFGILRDLDSREKEKAMLWKEARLPFVTGIYHLPAVELAAACLSYIL